MVLSLSFIFLPSTLDGSAKQETVKNNTHNRTKRKIRTSIFNKKNVFYPVTEGKQEKHYPPSHTFFYRCIFLMFSREGGKNFT